MHYLLISLLYFFKGLFSGSLIRIIQIVIGVVLLAKLAIRLFYSLVVIILAYSQHHVRI